MPIAFPVKRNDFGDCDLSDKDKFLFYTTDDGAVKVEVLYTEETVWLTQKALAELFGVQRPAITNHLKNIFETNEFAENSVSSILEHTAVDGKAYGTKYYNLDTIIAVGYRVKAVISACARRAGKQPEAQFRRRTGAPWRLHNTYRLWFIVSEVTV